ncbi:MAG: glutathione S-transferase N-terminal domain-containing protein [Kordiimonadaceae bacterium]|nr:glutathione S-transferase N-terminal domain-containing protein [Kordiimonadaceae bacterium]
MKLFEICAADQDVRFSPFVWRVIMGLHHKGLAFERVPLSFVDLATTLQTDIKTVPVLEDGGEHIVDSFEIIKYLERTYPEKPLFSPDELLPETPAGKQAIELNAWASRTVALGIFRLLVKDIHDVQDAENQAFFRATREPRIKKTLEEMHSGRDAIREDVRRSFGPLRDRLAKADYLSGDAPMWFDYTMFGMFQWARICSTYPVLAEDDIIHSWLDRMLDLYGGLGRTAKLAY